jgi:hypothetical protein
MAAAGGAHGTGRHEFAGGLSQGNLNASAQQSRYPADGLHDTHFQIPF